MKLNLIFIHYRLALVSHAPYIPRSGNQIVSQLLHIKEFLELQANTVLLDDVLAALDVHTAKWVVDRCLRGKLLRGRTVVLVTHNLALIGKLATRVVAVSSNGLAALREIPNDAPAHDPHLEVNIAEQHDGADDDAVDLEASSEGTKPANGKLIAAEEIVLGSVSYTAGKPN